MKALRFLLGLILACTFAIANQPLALSLTQNAFLLRKDDGNQLAATSYAALNTNASIAAGSTVRFRAQITCSGTVSGTGNLIVQYNRNSAGWVTTTTSTSYIKVVSSGSVSDATATTTGVMTAVGGGTFVAGSVDTADGSTTGVTLDPTNPDYTEMEYCVQIVLADVSNGDTIQLRCAKTGGTAFAAYTNTPTITVTKSGGHLNLSSTGAGRVAAKNHFAYWQ